MYRLIPTGLDSRRIQMSTKLNLGCGNDIRDGFLNIDAIQLPKQENCLQADLYDYMEKTVKPSSVDYILLQDVLEHFPHGLSEFNAEIRENPNATKTSRSLLTFCHTALKRKGKIKIRVPDIEWIISSWTKGDMSFPRFVWTMLGDIEHMEYDTHKSMWTASELERDLSRVGFQGIKVYQDNPNLVAEAVK